MKSFLPILLLSATLPCAASRAPSPLAAAPTTLHYTFDLHDPVHIRVTLDLVSRSPLSELFLPSQWAEQSELYKAVSDLRALTPGATLTATNSPARWLLQQSHPGPVTITYTLAQDWSGPLKHPFEHRAVIGPTLFELTGENALLSPALSGDDLTDVTFDFTGVSPRQSVVTSFGATVHQHFTGRWSEVRNALFAGGQLQTRTLLVDGHPVLLAMHGAWSFPLEEVAETVTRVLRTERRFWNDADIPYAAIVIAPYDDPLSGGGGSAFTNVFNLFLADRDDFSTDTASLLAHEAFHHWNPNGLGTVDDTQHIAWFTEGFTTFYQDALLVDAGLLTDSDYLGRLNATLRDYRLSPYLRATDADLARIPSPDRFNTQQPYLRGALIALWLGQQIRRQTSARRSLADLMQALRSERAQPLTADRIFATAARFVDAGTVRQLRTFALGGSPVPVLPGSLGSCVVFYQHPAWTFDLGFNAVSLRSKGVIQGVQQGSNAWHAGVRDGQLLGGFSLWSGDPEREVTLTLRDTDGRRERLTFLPRGKQVDVPQAESIAGCPKKPSFPLEP